MDKFPQVYPSNVNFRPGRIQSLTPEHELLLKQCWATLLTFWGYGVQLSDSDIMSPGSFVVSDIVATSAVANASKKEAHKKKRSLFSKKEATAPRPRPVSAKRSQELSQAASEKYLETLEASELTKNLYFNVFNQSYSNYFVSGDEQDLGSDAESIDTFVTAASSMSQTLADLGSLKIDSSETASFTSSIASNSNPGFRRKFSKYNPQDLHSALFKVVKNDLLDNFLLRYIRARKCKYEDAMAMLTKTLNWRHNECPVESWLAEGDAPSYVHEKNKGFVKNFTVSKAFIRGQDKNKNPLFMFQSRKHFASDTLPAETERFALLIIEWCRLYLRDVNESVDTCSLLFDLSGFSLKNADNAPVKFLMAMFQSHYPESLGIVVVHNAPWIFSTVWNVIKNWLDPVVASKIHFTKGYDELCEFIEPEHIPEYLGGKDTVELVYSKPSKEHITPPKAKDDEFFRLCALRDELYLKFIDVTIKWIESTSPEVSSLYLKEKIYLSEELSNNYIALDPYIRNPGVFDRNGFLTLKN